MSSFPIRPRSSLNANPVFDKQVDETRFHPRRNSGTKPHTVCMRRHSLWRSLVPPYRCSRGHDFTDPGSSTSGSWAL